MAVRTFHGRKPLLALSALVTLWVAVSLSSSMPALAASSDPALSVAGSAQTNRLQRLLANLPLYFIENQGQLDRRAAYYVPGRDKIVYFAAGGLTVLLHGPRRQGGLARSS